MYLAHDLYFPDAKVHETYLSINKEKAIGLDMVLNFTPRHSSSFEMAYNFYFNTYFALIVWFYNIFNFPVPSAVFVEFAGYIL